MPMLLGCCHRVGGGTPNQCANQGSRPCSSPCHRERSEGTGGRDGGTEGLSLPALERTVAEQVTESVLLHVPLVAVLLLRWRPRCCRCHGSLTLSVKACLNALLTQAHLCRARFPLTSARFCNVCRSQAAHVEALWCRECHQRLQPPRGPRPLVTSALFRWWTR